MLALATREAFPEERVKAYSGIVIFSLFLGSSTRPSHIYIYVIACYANHMTVMFPLLSPLCSPTMCEST
jgi:hypothetical protein